MTCKNKRYKWYNYCNNGNGDWGFLWKDVHEEWKNKQGKKPSVIFYNPSNNALIYFSYIINTNKDSTEEEAKVGYDG